MAAIIVPAIEISQGTRTLYVFSIKAKELWNNVSINTRNADKEEGYQRTLSTSRVKALSAYIDAQNILPTSIFISLDENSSFSKGKLKIADSPEAGWVVDGQHRLAGAFEADRDIELSVVAMIGADFDEQVRQFVTINKEAKGVPSSLYLDLRNHLPSKKTSKQAANDRAADIAQFLKKDEDSIFFGRLVLTGPKRGQVSLTNFVRKLSPYLIEDKGFFADYTFEEQKGIVDNYFKGFKATFPKQFWQDKMVFFKTLGFGALLNVLPTVFTETMKKHGGFTVDNVADLLKAIDYFNFDTWENFGSGNGAEILAGNDLRTELSKSLSQTGDSGKLKLR